MYNIYDIYNYICIIYNTLYVYRTLYSCYLSTTLYSFIELKSKIEFEKSNSKIRYENWIPKFKSKIWNWIFDFENWIGELKMKKTKDILGTILAIPIIIGAFVFEIWIIRFVTGFLCNIKENIEVLNANYFFKFFPISSFREYSWILSNSEHNLSAKIIIILYYVYWLLSTLIVSMKSWSMPFACSLLM